MTDATTPSTTPSESALDRTAPDAAPTKRRRFKIDKTLLLVSLVIGVGLALVTRGLMIGVTGDERAGLPPLVEEVNPVPQAEQALSQTSVFVDLAAGYTGVLVIDGVELPTVDVSAVANDGVEPGEQISVPAATVYEPGNATLTFVPSEAAEITEFTEGEHQVTLLYWALDETPEQARRFTWTFNVI